jgi:hypothetical protein
MFNPATTDDHQKSEIFSLLSLGQKMKTLADILSELAIGSHHSLHSGNVLLVQRSAQDRLGCRIMDCFVASRYSIEPLQDLMDRIAGHVFIARDDGRSHTQVEGSPQIDFETLLGDVFIFIRSHCNLTTRFAKGRACFPEDWLGILAAFDRGQ